MKNKPDFTYYILFANTGFLSGVAYSFYQKTGFWKGLGIAIIGGFALGGVGYSIDYARNKKRENNEK